MANVTQIAKSVIKSVEEKLKILSKVKGETIESANIDPDDVRNFVRLKAERDAAIATLEKAGKLYEEARQKIIKQLPGTEKDIVDVTIEGFRIHKYPRNTAAGKLNEEKVLQLAKKKKLLGKIAPMVRKVNKQALIEAIANNKISYEEYLDCTTQNIVPVIEIEIIHPLEQNNKIQVVN